MVLAMTAMSSTTTAEKKKMVAVAAHISDRVLVSAETSTSPWATVTLPSVEVMGRPATYRRSG